MSDRKWSGDAFAAYAAKANSIAKHHPAPLIGPIKTRREAMGIYTEIIAAMRRCDNVKALQVCLDGIESLILQFHAELDFLWLGDGADFRGLEREIEDAFEAAEAAQWFSGEAMRRLQEKARPGALPGQSGTGTRQ